MRLLRLLAALSVLILIAVGPSLAGPGTAVYRGTFPVVWFWWNDYEVANIAFTSSDPQFYVDWFCGGATGPLPDPGPVFKPLSYHDLFYIASGKENYWIKGPQFTRVYGRFSGPLDPNGSWATPTWVCDVLKGYEGQLLAEGVSEFRWNDHNSCNLGPGQNTWDQRAIGTLTSQPGVCGAGLGMAQFDFTFHYMLTKDAVVIQVPGDGCYVDDPTHVRKVVIQGPDLKCIGK